MEETLIKATEIFEMHCKSGLMRAIVPAWAMRGNRPGLDPEFRPYGSDTCFRVIMPLTSRLVGGNQMRRSWLLGTGCVVAVMLTGLGQGCDGCGCRKPAEVAVATPEKAPEHIPGLPVPDPEPVQIGPDSPDADLATHFGISADKIAELKKAHAALPGISRPAGLVVTPARLKPVPTDQERAKEEAIPTEAEPVLSGPERVTGLPALKVILGHEFKAAKTIDPAELAAESVRLRRLLFNRKLPIFADPILFIDSTLESAQSEVNVTIGIPVPEGVDVPPGIKVREVRAGKCLFASNMRIDEVALTEESWKAMTSPSMLSLIGSPCKLAVLVDLAGWPKPGERSRGEGYFFCM